MVQEMGSITQHQAVDQEALGRKDQVCFWRDERWDDLECLSATFVKHAYAPHTHDTFVFGVIESGVELYRLKGQSLSATAGDVCVVNPCELHDGRPGGEGYRYRMFYPSVEVMSDLQSQITECAPSEVYFPEPKFRDPELFRMLCVAHRVMENAPTSLERDSAFLQAASQLIRRYADLSGAEISVGSESKPVRLVCDYAQDNLASDLDLSRLSELAGFSRYRLIRTFRKEKGLTPHAWITNRRVERAKTLLAQGEMPSAVAPDCGFYDQAHLTRHFKRATGVTPGKYREAFLG